MIKLHDRIKELSYTIGTGDLELSGAVAGFSSFSSCYSNNDLLFYVINDGTNYELGSGMYLSATNAIKRFPVKSTNNNNLVVFTQGTKEVYVNYPATNAVFNTSGIFPVPQNSGIAFWTSSNSLSYSDKFVIDSGNGRIGINKKNPSYALDLGGLSPNAIIRSSGLIIGKSGIYFPSGNNDVSSYSGGMQLVHFEPNQLSFHLSSVLQLSGIVNQNILLKKQNVGMVFAGPSGHCNPTCDPDYPSFRYLTKDDIPEEISNLTIGDENSTSFLKIDLPQNLSNNQYQNTKVISVDNGSEVFVINGLGHIGTGTIGYNQVVGLNSLSTTLHTKIDDVSGILNDRIDSLSLSSSMSSNLSNGRLSLSSYSSTLEGVNSTLYFVPHNGDSISLYNGTAWISKTFSATQVAVAATLDADTNYDIFANINYDDTINYSYLAWIDDSTRTTELVVKDGVYCLGNTNFTHRYLGTVRRRSDAALFSNTTDKRFIFNAENRILSCGTLDNSTSWTYSSSSFRISPVVPTLGIVHGLKEKLDVYTSLKFSSPYARSSYVLCVDSIRSNRINSGGNLGITPTNAICNDQYIDVDYNDAIQTDLTASMHISFDGYDSFYAIEKVPVGSSPTLSINQNLGSHGMKYILYY